jgi:hypothetical protein
VELAEAEAELAEDAPTVLSTDGSGDEVGMVVVELVEVVELVKLENIWLDAPAGDRPAPGVESLPVAVLTTEPSEAVKSVTTTVVHVVEVATAATAALVTPTAEVGDSVTEPGMGK